MTAICGSHDIQHAITWQPYVVTWHPTCYHMVSACAHICNGALAYRSEWQASWTGQGSSALRRWGPASGSPCWTAQHEQTDTGEKDEKPHVTEEARRFIYQPSDKLKGLQWKFQILAAKAFLSLIQNVLLELMTWHDGFDKKFDQC